MTAIGTGISDARVICPRGALALALSAFAWAFPLAVLLPIGDGPSAGPIPPRMRALHMEGNWGGNQTGIKRVGPSPLLSATSISVASVTVGVSRSSFVDSYGRTITNDSAAVRMQDVQMGSGAHYNNASFHVIRNVDTGTVFVMFVPSNDTWLSEIQGFDGDIAFILSPDGKQVDRTPFMRTTGPALEYVTSVIANAPELLANVPVSVSSPATLDQTAILQSLATTRSRINDGLDEYFAFLKAENVEWLGISVAIFYDSIADPTVRVKYRPPGDTTFTIYTFDDQDLTEFIKQARGHGLKVYLTLAFEPSFVPDSPADPTCLTAQFKYDRTLLGYPGSALTPCINPSLWWWSPAHPKHATNVAQFWSSFTDVAVKYAKLAHQWGVDMYSLGTETDRLFRTRVGSGAYVNHFATQLGTLVAAVRAEYKGVLTYNQSYSVLQHPEYFEGAGGSIYLFSDLNLDAVGISAAFELASSPPNRVLSVAELEALWESIFQKYLVPLQVRNPGKPVIFTELDYLDDVNTVWISNTNALKPMPPRSADGTTDGMRQQSNAFEAFFNVNERYDNLVRGGFIWGTQIFLDAPWLCDTINFAIYCRPAAQTVAAAYARWREPAGAGILANPYGPLTVQGGKVAGNTIAGLQPNAVIQLGNVAGTPGSFVELEFNGFSVGPSNTLTIRSGASGQSVLIRDVYDATSVIEGTLHAEGGGGNAPPMLYFQNRSGISVAPGGTIGSATGLILDALGTAASTGQRVLNAGTVDGGAALRLLAAGINGGGAFKGNSIVLSTFGNANNPVNGAFFLQNGLQLHPSTGNVIALTLNGYAAAKQVFNLYANGNASVWMPSAWPAGTTLPTNNAVVMPSGARTPGVPEPGYGGGSMILQASGSLTLVNAGTNDFVFPGAVVLKAEGDLNINGVAVDQGWTTSGQSFQGIFFESPNIVSPSGNIRVYGNDLNWINFSTLPKASVRANSLKRNTDGSASFAATDSTTPHINTYSVIQNTAASGGCWTCIINTQPVNMYGP